MRELDRTLFIACERGQVSKVQELVRENPELLHSRDYEGRQPLHVASKRGNGEVVKLLLDRFRAANGPKDLTCHIDARDVNGCTPLHLACGALCLPAVRLLLINGADINARSNNKSTAAHVAASALASADDEEAGESLSFRQLESHFLLRAELTRLSSHRDENKVKEKISTNMAFLWSAARKRERELQKIRLKHCISKEEQIFMELLHYGFTLNEVDGYGRTVLQIACARGHARIAEFFLSKGARMDTADCVGATPLHDAAANGHVDIAALLLRESLFREPLNSLRLLDGRLENDGVLQREDSWLLWSETTKIECDEDDSDSDAEMEIDLDQLEEVCFETLDDIERRQRLEVLGEMDMVTRRKQICSHCFGRRQDLRPLGFGGFGVELPLFSVISDDASRGVDIDAQDENGETALVRAVSYRQHSVVSLLLCYGADPNLGACSGQSPLSLAASLKETRLLRVLMYAGAAVCEGDVEREPQNVDEQSLFRLMWNEKERRKAELFLFLSVFRRRRGKALFPRLFPELAGAIAIMAVRPYPYF